MKTFATSIIMLATSAAWAAQVPVPGAADARVRYVTYDRDEVTTIFVQRGTATRIILEPDEKIVGAGVATGFAAECDKVEYEWCIRADDGANQLLIKPKDGATHNNLELKTNKRDYSFAFRVIPDGARNPGNSSARRPITAPMYRVMFRYPETTPLSGKGAYEQPTGQAASLHQRLAKARPIPRNWKYSMHAWPGASNIVPTLAFDDGRFTYLRFAANREIPTIFYVSPNGEEGRVNFHIDATDSSLLVVERLTQRLVLRLGEATVGIWNDAFDTYGRAPVDGTTVPGVARDLRQGGKP